MQRTPVTSCDPDSEGPPTKRLPRIRTIAGYPEKDRLSRFRAVRTNLESFMRALMSLMSLVTRISHYCLPTFALDMPMAVSRWKYGPVADSTWCCETSSSEPVTLDAELWATLTPRV